jgi:hypothetical protein
MNARKKQRNVLLELLGVPGAETVIGIFGVGIALTPIEPRSYANPNFINIQTSFTKTATFEVESSAQFMTVLGLN